MSQKCALNICNKLKQYDADDKKKNCTTTFINYILTYAK